MEPYTAYRAAHYDFYALTGEKCAEVHASGVRCESHPHHVGACQGGTHAADPKRPAVRWWK